jgi:hypothetical protein
VKNDLAGKRHALRVVCGVSAFQPNLPRLTSTHCGHWLVGRIADLSPSVTLT